MPIWNYDCDECDYSEEKVVRTEDRDSQECVKCGAMLTRDEVCSGAFWFPSRERSHAMLKRRSEAHSQEMLQKGYDPNSQGSLNSGSESWTNARRNKNKQKGFVKKMLDAHSDIIGKD